MQWALGMNQGVQRGFNEASFCLAMKRRARRRRTPEGQHSPLLIHDAQNAENKLFEKRKRSELQPLPLIRKPPPPHPNSLCKDPEAVLILNNAACLLSLHPCIMCLHYAHVCVVVVAGIPERVLFFTGEG